MPGWLDRQPGFFTGFAVFRDREGKHAGGLAKKEGKNSGSGMDQGPSMATKGRANRVLEGEKVSLDALSGAFTFDPPEFCMRLGFS